MQCICKFVPCNIKIEFFRQVRIMTIIWSFIVVKRTCHYFSNLVNYNIFLFGKKIKFETADNISKSAILPWKPERESAQFLTQKNVAARVTTKIINSWYISTQYLMLITCTKALTLGAIFLFSQGCKYKNISQLFLNSFFHKFRCWKLIILLNETDLIT